MIVKRISWAVMCVCQQSERVEDLIPVDKRQTSDFSSYVQAALTRAKKDLNKYYVA